MGYPVVNLGRRSPVDFNRNLGAWMGQAEAGVTCEDTPEGGKRCSDGTYHPPGCPMNQPQTTVQAQAPTSESSNAGLIAAGVAAVAVGGYLLLAGRRPRMGVAPALETAYPGAFSRLQKIAGNINRERGNDAYWFQRHIDAGKRRQDLVFVEGNAEKVLAEQSRIWESFHQNADKLLAAQEAYDAASALKANAAAERDEAKAGIDMAASNVATYRQNAEAIAASLPADYQAEARRVIDPCTAGRAALEGRIPVRPLMRGTF